MPVAARSNQQIRESLRRGADSHALTPVWEDATVASPARRAADALTSAPRVCPPVGTTVNVSLWGLQPYARVLPGADATVRDHWFERLLDEAASAGMVACTLIDAQVREARLADGTSVLVFGSGDTVTVEVPIFKERHELRHSDCELELADALALTISRPRALTAGA